MSNINPKVHPVAQPASPPRRKYIFGVKLEEGGLFMGGVHGRFETVFGPDGVPTRMDVTYKPGDPILLTDEEACSDTFKGRLTAMSGAQVGPSVPEQGNPAPLIPLVPVTPTPSPNEPSADEPVPPHHAAPPIPSADAEIHPRLPSPDDGPNPLGVVDSPSAAPVREAKDWSHIAGINAPDLVKLIDTLEREDTAAMRDAEKAGRRRAAVLHALARRSRQLAALNARQKLAAKKASAAAATK